MAGEHLLCTVYDISCMGARCVVQGVWRMAYGLCIVQFLPGPAVCLPQLAVQAEAVVDEL